MSLDSILDRSYMLYMPQIRAEIRAAAMSVDKFINSLPPPVNILEIGTKYGGTFNIWASLNTHPLSRNISVDMSDGGIHGGISEEAMDARDARFREHFQNVHFVRGDSHNPATFDRVQELLDGGRVHFLFIDGDHSKDGVIMDFNMYAKLLADTSVVMFHDIVDSERHRKRGVYVGDAWREIMGRYPDQLKHEIIAGEDWAGIGLIQFAGRPL